MGPDVKGNPLYFSVYLLIASYIIGEYILPKYSNNRYFSNILLQSKIEI